MDLNKVHKSTLTINEGFTINFTQPIPNAWHRFWTWFFLGWKWQSLDVEKQIKKIELIQSKLKELAIKQLAKEVKEKK